MGRKANLSAFLLLTLFKVGFYLPTIVLYYVAKAKASPRQALSLKVYGETRSPNIERQRGGRGSTGRRSITSRPLLHEGSRLVTQLNRRLPTGRTAPAPRHPPGGRGKRRLTWSSPLPTPVSPQRASSRLLPVDWGWLKAGPVCGRESGRREPGRRARPEPAARGHGAAPAAAAAKLALASREPASGGRRLTERI